jgi:hypothetical protein
MSFHLAGIIPVAGQPLDFNLPWHDCLMPIGKDYLAIERSVVECANAGCETIWIVCRKDVQPLIRHRLGDWVQDPAWISRKYEYNRADHKKQIPIYYVPLHLNDIKRRECTSWSMLHGAYIARKIAMSMSKWLAPDKYYVSFPHGVCFPTEVRKYRNDISSKNSFFLSHLGKTALDGELLGFTFTYDDYIKIKDYMKNQCYQLNKPIKVFTLKDSLSYLSNEKAIIKNLDTYHRIDSWQAYCDFISASGHRFKKPSKLILNYHEWNGIGTDE